MSPRKPLYQLAYVGISDFGSNGGVVRGIPPPNPSSFRSQFGIEDSKRPKGYP
jgi:hypothetical protein